MDELVKVTAGQPPAAYVFQAARGGPMDDGNWRTREFNIAAKDADLDALGITPHKLRHKAASAAIAAGADVKVVQQMLGHKDATETLNTYGHLWPDRLDEVSNALEAARAEALRNKATVLHVPRMSPIAN
ncbi:tyrosine-type recombinase/integrase [Arthrobacter wenxiniae]|uniref:tyrosine-type recombinase/integrase n=1 Tax=Arthrobacter wenxiniae TaxID=2713570 RepID=UPI0031B5C4AF